jgi:hypothetical protein
LQPFYSILNSETSSACSLIHTLCKGEKFPLNISAFSDIYLLCVAVLHNSFMRAIKAKL